MAQITAKQMQSVLEADGSVMLVPFTGDDPLLVKRVHSDREPVTIIVQESNRDELCLSWDNVCRNYEMVVK